MRATGVHASRTSSRASGRKPAGAKGTRSAAIMATDSKADSGWSDLQQQVGNRAIGRMFDDRRAVAGSAPLRRSAAPPIAVQRKPDGRAKPQTSGPGWKRVGPYQVIIDNYPTAARGSAPRLEKAPDVRKTMSAKLPQLIAVMTSAEIAQWQRVVDAGSAQQEADLWENRMESARSAQGYIQHVDGYDRWLRQLRAPIPKVAPADLVLDLDPMRLVDPGIYDVGLDRAATLRFRTWALEKIVAKKLHLKLWDAFRSSEAPSAAMMTLGRYSQGGRITAFDLEREFPKEYDQMVVNRPEVKQLRQLAAEFQATYNELHPVHVERSALNKKYSGFFRFVRIYSEAFGEGDEDYPSLTLWQKPKERLDNALALLAAGDMEGAAKQLMNTSGPMSFIANKFVAYETRVQTGAAVAVKWAGRLKVAGTLAAGVAAGPLGLVRSSLVAGGYTAVSEGAQQASAVATGQQDSMHWKELATGAGITTVMSLFGGAIQSRFKTAILARMGAAEAATVNVVDDWLAGVLASSTSTVYQLPVQMVLERVAAGKAFPGSADELADMVVEEAINNGTISAATDAIMARAGHGPSADPADAVGAELLGDHATKTTEPTKAATAAEPGPKAGGTGEPAPGKGGAAAGEPAAGRGPADPATADRGATDHSTDAPVGENGRPDKSQVPDKQFETGLLSEQAKKRLAKGAVEAYEKLGLNDPKKVSLSEAELTRAVNTIEKVVAAELKASGMPMPKVEVVQMKNTGANGSYDRSNHTIRINSNASKFRGPGGFQKLLGTIVHETRHAEQVFDALRVRAGEAPTGLDPHLIGSSIAAETRVAPELAHAAAEKPIRANDTSAEAMLGREIWSESFREGPRKDLRDWAQLANSRRGGVEAKLQGIQQTANRAKRRTGDKKYDAVLEGAERVRTELENAYDHYWDLAAEIDARRVQSHVEGLFQAKLRLQQDVSVLTDHLRAAEDAFQRLQPYKGAALDSLVDLLRYQNELRDALQNQLGLMPTSADSPTGATPAK